MTVTILRRTFNVRISISMFGIEIEISVQDGRTNSGLDGPGPVLSRLGSSMNEETTRKYININAFDNINAIPYTLLIVILSDD